MKNVDLNLVEFLMIFISVLNRVAHWVFRRIFITIPHTRVSRSVKFKEKKIKYINLVTLLLNACSE